MTKNIVGVMGPGDNATKEDLKNAFQLGKLIAEKGWLLLTGGRDMGVMKSAMEGAKSADGLTIGILPDNNINKISPLVDIPILTDLGNGRNNVNVLSSHVIIACGIGLGTISEIALALKNGKKVIFLTDNKLAIDLFLSLTKNDIFVANSPQEAIKYVNIK